MTKVFFDTEFTGLHQATTLLSIGLISETGHTFYAELIDYDPAQINDWLEENVLTNFVLGNYPIDTATVERYESGLTDVNAKGDAVYVAGELKEWLAALGPVQMWSDVLAYDWVLLVSLLADYTNGYPQLPEDVHYIPMDIATLMQFKGVDPDINREDYGMGISTADMPKHNALWDARIIRACYQKLVA